MRTKTYISAWLHDEVKWSVIELMFYMVSIFQYSSFPSFIWFPYRVSTDKLFAIVQLWYFCQRPTLIFHCRTFTLVRAALNLYNIKIIKSMKNSIEKNHIFFSESALFLFDRHSSNVLLSNWCYIFLTLKFNFLITLT